MTRRRQSVDDVEGNSQEEDVQAVIRQPGWLASCFPIVSARKPSARRGANHSEANNVQVVSMCTPEIVKAISAANARQGLPTELKPGEEPKPGSLHPVPAERPSVESVFVARQLHVRVITAKGLSAAKNDGTSDPFVCVRVGDETFRTAVAKRRLEATYADAFAFNGECARQANYIVELEVWSFDEWHYDDFLGQAEIDLRQVPLYMDSRPVSCTAQLYVLKRNGKKEKREFGEVQVVIWSTPENAKEQYLSPGLWYQNITPEVMSLCAPRKRLPSVQTNMVGTLYEEPCIAYIKVSLVGMTGLFEALGKKPPPMVCPITGRILFSLTGRCSLAPSAYKKEKERDISCPVDFGDERPSTGVNGAASNAVRAALANQLKDKVQSMLPIVKFQKWRQGSLDSRGSSGGTGQLGWTGSLASTMSINPAEASGARFRRGLMKSMRSVGNATRRRTSNSLPALPEFFLDEVNGELDDEGLMDDEDRGFEDVVRDYDGLSSSPTGASSPQEDIGSWGSGEVDPDKLASSRAAQAAALTTDSGAERPSSGPARRRRGSTEAAGGDGATAPLRIGVPPPSAFKQSPSYQSIDSFGSSAGSSGGNGGGGSSNVQSSASGSVFSAVGTASAGRTKRYPFVYFKLSYAKQVFRSRLKRLNKLGETAHDESFVFATVRPLDPRPLEVNVYICNDRTRKGRLISRTSYEMNDMLQLCAVAPRTAPPGQSQPDVIRNPKWADEFALPVLRWPLEHLQGQLRMHVGLADADYRAEMYHVPLVDPAAVVRRDSLTSPMATRITSASNSLPDTTQRASSGRAATAATVAATAGEPAPRAGSGSRREGTPDSSRHSTALRVVEEEIQKAARNAGSNGVASPFTVASETVDAESPAAALASPSSVTTARSAPSSASLAASDVDSAWARESARKRPPLFSSAGLKDSFKSLKHVLLRPPQKAGSEAPVAAPPAKAQLIPIGTLMVKCEKVEMSLPNVSFFALVKFGPHWLQTKLNYSNATTSSHFEMRLPIYDPSDALTFVCFISKSGSLMRKSKRDIIPFARTIIPLSALPINAEVLRVNHTVRSFADDGEPKVWEEGQSGYGTITAHLRMKVMYNDKARLIQSYVVRPPRPPAWYTLGLDDADQHVIEKQYRKIVGRWLESCSSPLPASCVKLVLASERDRFQMSVLMGNWRRLVQALEWVLLLRDGLNHIMSWRNRCHSIMAYCLIFCVCFVTTPVVSLLIGAACLAVWGQRHRAHTLADEVVAVDEDADDDEDVVAPTNNPYTELKRKYEEIVGLALMVQNYLDDAACFVERLQSMHNWRDYMSSVLFTAVLGVAAVAIYILGLPLVLCLVLMWVLRPPKLRDPEPTPIENYFSRLPTVQIVARSAHLKKTLEEAPAATAVATR